MLNGTEEGGEEEEGEKSYELTAVDGWRERGWLCLGLGL